MINISQHPQFFNHGNKPTMQELLFLSTFSGFFSLSFFFFIFNFFFLRGKRNECNYSHFSVEGECVEALGGWIANDEATLFVLLLQQRLGTLSWHITHIPSVIRCMWSLTLFFFYSTKNKVLSWINGSFDFFIPNKKIKYFTISFHF